MVEWWGTPSIQVVKCSKKLTWYVPYDMGFDWFKMTKSWSIIFRKRENLFYSNPTSMKIRSPPTFDSPKKTLSIRLITRNYPFWFISFSFRFLKSQKWLELELFRGNKKTREWDGELVQKWKWQTKILSNNSSDLIHFLNMNGPKR